MKKTWAQLQREINSAQDVLRLLQAEQQSHFGSIFIEAVESQLELDLFANNPGERLGLELTNRDEPMSEQDIRAIFEFSGYSYTEQDVQAACPDSQETIDDQIRHYRD